MAKLTEKQWLEVKALYECGHGVTELSKRFDTPKSTLQSKVKKESWQQGEIAQEIIENATALNVIHNISHKIAQNRTDTEIRTINDEILNLANVRNLAKQSQENMFEVLALATKQVKQLMQNSPDGLYIAGDGDKGVRYGRTTEFVKDLIPAMNAANAILGVSKEQPTTNVQINNSTHAEVTMPNNAIDASKAYQQLINDSQ
jgi:hypothetical protein